METLATVLASLDEVETRIADMELETSSLRAQMEWTAHQPRTDDQVALDLADRALTLLWSQRSLLLAKSDERRGARG